MSKYCVTCLDGKELEAINSMLKDLASKYPKGRCIGFTTSKENTSDACLLTIYPIIQDGKYIIDTQAGFRRLISDQ
jgi:hypothetical protein